LGFIAVAFRVVLFGDSRATAHAGVKRTRQL
jgi:hypothetical protein